VWVGKAGLVLGLGCGWGKAGFSGLVVGLMGLVSWSLGRKREKENKTIKKYYLKKIKSGIEIIV
jgi:hypothetical protein